MVRLPGDGLCHSLHTNSTIFSRYLWKVIYLTPNVMEGAVIVQENSKGACSTEVMGVVPTPEWWREVAAFLSVLCWQPSTVFAGFHAGLRTCQCILGLAECWAGVIWNCVR